MRRAGLLESVRRGYFRVTERGRQLLAEAPTRIDGDVLLRYPEFAAWVQASRSGRSADEPPAVPQDASPAPIESTPDEQIDTAAQLLTAELEAQLLDRLRLVEPATFEQIVVDLLIAMGFGGGDPEMGKRLGRSGDGGVDGVIQEDVLGLDAVYVQAKRYGDGNNVGAPDLRGFVGSLVGNRASKGVFVTASKFTADAREYARNVQHRVVLIDGAELVRLMVRHGVGVRVERTVVIKRLDEDYFSDE
jgi:restriction system protein